MSLAIGFITANVLLFAAYLFCMRKHPFRTWDVHQRYLLFLLLALFLYNDPLFALKYIYWGWVFVFLDCIFKVILLSLILLYLLFGLDHVHHEETKLQWGIATFPKYASVSLFFIFYLVMYSWENIRDRINPIFGVHDTLGGVSAFFVLTLLTYVVIVVWLSIITFLSLRTVRHSPAQLKRFLFLAVPSVLVVISEMAYVLMTFFGSGDTAVQLVFFTVLFNVYICGLCFGFWPAGPAGNSPDALEAAEEVKLLTS
eukprot:TRINITY_DN2778_c0_g1_i7.p1 TRINITY_DN2778_c0_g1~~TRINITY_DN2778_c0_g1_i7.p1  ORF type:complete len:256 (-),score=69.73 TRINITY_DN2778_c0_g1_i7:72-839(-)